MRRFSIGTSLNDGFSLVARRPLAVFVWGLLMAAPMFAIFAAMLPIMGQMASLSVEAGADGTPVGPYAEAPDMPPEFFAHIMQFQAASILGNLAQLLGTVVVYTAVMRAILRPKESRFFSMRVGMDEVRVAVVGMAIGVGLYVVMIVAVMLGVGVGVAFWGASLEAGAAWAIAIVLVLGLVLACCWGFARASLLAPASVLYRDFAFAKGWRLASGKGWGLLGLLIAVMLISLLFQFVLMSLTVGVLFAVFGAGAGVAPDWTTSVNPFAEVANWFATHWYWGVAAGAVGSIFYGVTITLSVAPFASACRQLAEGDGNAEGSTAPVA